MKKSFQRTGTVVLAWIFVLTSNRAFQATVTYHFTANNFMDATSPYVTFVSVSGNFTVSSLLINVSGIVSVNSFSFSEGVNTITNADTGGSFLLDTDGSGRRVVQRC